MHLTKPVGVDFPILAAPWDCLQPAMAVALRGGAARSAACPPPPLVLRGRPLPLGLRHHGMRARIPVFVCIFLTFQEKD